MSDIVSLHSPQWDVSYCVKEVSVPLIALKGPIYSDGY